MLHLEIRVTVTGQQLMKNELLLITLTSISETCSSWLKNYMEEGEINALLITQ